MDSSQNPSQITTPAHANDVPLRHSGPGIASFIIGLISILLAIVGLLILTVWVGQYMEPDGSIALPEVDEVTIDPLMLAGFLLFFLGFLLSVVGLVLGIVGCVIRNRRRVFPILGLVFNAMLSVGTIAIFVIGLSVRQMS